MSLENEKNMNEDLIINSLFESRFLRYLITEKLAKVKHEDSGKKA